MNRDNLKCVELLVRIYIDEDADVMEVVQDMDYEFRHPAIKDTCIEDIITEL